MLDIIIPTLSFECSAKSALTQAAMEIHSQLSQQGFQILRSEFYKGHLEIDLSREEQSLLLVIDLFGRRILQEELVTSHLTKERCEIQPLQNRRAA